MYFWRCYMYSFDNQILSYFCAVFDGANVLDFEVRVWEMFWQE